MAKVVIYTKEWCPYCFRAKAVLDAKEVEYEEFDVEADTAKEKELLERTGATTVPRIFINDKLIGDAGDLGALVDSGKLDGLLAEEA